MTDPSTPSLRFGAFAFFPTLRRLERNGDVVELSSRAIDILAVLTERPGEVVSKRELLERVWPNTFVVEAALRFHMVALRRALGDRGGGARLIQTVAGRGYSFVAPIQSHIGFADAEVLTPTVASRRLPPAPAAVFGRDAAIEALLDRLELNRFVSIVGPGGIGKTTVALAAAHRWAGTHDGTVVFVDLVGLAADDEAGIAEGLCAMLGIETRGAGPIESVLAHLRAAEALIVLDTCEGVIEAAARLAERLVAAEPGVQVLATSRETLRADGEFVYRIEPLEAPTADADLTAQAALSYSALQLFAERAAAGHAGFALSDQDAPIAAAVCRELGGLPLAIELAAGRVEAFGVRKVAELLSTEFALTWPGRRTATPRQQTLNATLNWSHELLTPSERKVFRRLAAFVGTFSLESATAACADADLPVTEVIQALASLVAKSLICTVQDGSLTRYRMLDIARAYGLGKLMASGEEGEVRRRQAVYYTQALKRVEAERVAAEREDFAEASEKIANVRAVLGWAFEKEGTEALAIELSAAAAPLWSRMGLLADSRRWTREALARLDRGATVPSELEARVALAGSLMYTHGITEESYRNWEVVYRRARFEGRNDLRLGGLNVLWGHQIRLAHFGAAQRLLDESDFLDSVNGDATVTPAFHWMGATTAHYRGDHEACLIHSQRVFAELNEPASRLMRHLLGYDLEVGTLRCLSLSHFYLGEIGKALALRARALERAAALSYVAPLENTLYWQAFIAYQLENAEEFDRLMTSMTEVAKPDALQPTVGWGIALQGLELVRQGNVAGGRKLVSRGMNICQQGDFRVVDDFMAAELALQLARQSPPGSEATWGDLQDPEEESWCSPEVLRIQGELAERSDDAASAEARYLDALVVSERQGALFWRLRAGVSLASLWLAQGRAAEAVAVLAPIYAQCDPHPDWPDLRRAAACLDTCRRVGASANAP